MKPISYKEDEKTHTIGYMGHLSVYAACLADLGSGEKEISF